MKRGIIEALLRKIKKLSGLKDLEDLLAVFPQAHLSYVDRAEA